jgi:hypothetical protein
VVAKWATKWICPGHRCGGSGWLACWPPNPWQERGCAVARYRRTQARSAGLRQPGKRGASPRIRNPAVNPPLARRKRAGDCLRDGFSQVSRCKCEVHCGPLRLSLQQCGRGATRKVSAARYDSPPAAPPQRLQMALRVGVEGLPSRRTSGYVRLISEVWGRALSS